MSDRFVAVGSKFGKWTVIEQVQSVGSANEYNDKDRWRCQCECGSRAVFTSDRLYIIAMQKDKYGWHDGCWRCRPVLYFERMRKVRDASYRKTYTAWSSMRNRCNNPHNPNYVNYGGRGITVCDEWNLSFKAFYNYVSKLEHYGEQKRSLDRIDNNKGYFPGNVRWATQKEQCNNRRPKRLKSKNERDIIAKR